MQDPKRIFINDDAEKAEAAALKDSWLNRFNLNIRQVVDGWLVQQIRERYQGWGKVSDYRFAVLR